MGHMIERKADGSYSMAYAGTEKPWHGLGKSVPHDLTPEQMLVAAGLDWSVVKQPLYRKVNDEFQPAGNYALVRDHDNKILDYVSESWEPVQNAEAFGFFHEFVMAGDMSMDTAGSLRDGKNVWALAKIKNAFSVFGKDEIESYILFSNPHRFGAALEILTTNIRTVCNNTLTYALESASSNRVRMTHAKKFDADEVKRIMGIAEMKNVKYKEAGEYLATRKYTGDEAMEFFAGIYPKITRKDDKDLSRNAKIAIDIIENQPGAQLFPGTWWNVFNAVTFLSSHENGRDGDARLSNQWFGASQKTNLRALNKALEMAS